MKSKVLYTLACFLPFAVINTSASFNDIGGEEWFYSHVETLVQEGIIGGYEDGTFRPKNNITNAEVLKIIATVLNLEIIPVDNAIHWAQPYQTALIKAGVTKDALSVKLLNSSATRQYVAEKFFGALKTYQVNSINILPPFEDTIDERVHTLYTLGIVTGEEQNQKLYFKPSANITRAEVAAMTNRYLAIDQSAKDIKKIHYKAPLVQEVVSPTTKDRFEQVFLYMVVNNLTTYTIKYPEVSFGELTENLQYNVQLSEAFSRVFDDYPEYFTFNNKVGLSTVGNQQSSEITIDLSSSYFPKEETKIMHQEYVKEIEDVLHVLRVSGEIQDHMTQYDLAKVFFEWLVLNKKYDLSYSDVSYTAYGMSELNQGVCQGYVANFNLLCKLMGIEVVGVSGVVDGVEHMWAKAILDGREVYIDPTFGDPTPDRRGYIDYKYFDISEQELRKTHIF